MYTQNPVISRRELERRHAGLLDMRRYLAQQEQEFNARRLAVQAFAERYQAMFGPLYKELGYLDSQLRTTTHALIKTLRLRGIELRLPEPPAAPIGGQLQTQMPQLTQMVRVEGLPSADTLPPVPQGADISQWAPPTLKMLYRRAAMRAHPDRAGADAERDEREQRMMAVNAAFAAHDRQALEAILLEAGEDPAKVTGGNIQALCNWLAHCEERVQARLRLVNSYRSALDGQGMCKLWQSVSQAESRGLDPMSFMAFKLREQIAERRKELYIALRVKPESSLARAFLHQRAARVGASLFA
ncbi:MAG: J domain-containing protein [Paucibacter sp.]|nr:J domain-containing protein [Roseateles sp.]